MLKPTYDIQNLALIKIPHSVGIVPYFGGDWRTGKPKTPYRLIYLIKTLASLLQHVDEVHIYHVEKDRIDFISNLFPNTYLHILNPPLEKDGGTTVYPIGKYAILDGVWKKFEYIFFTESDQVILSRNLWALVKSLPNESYLSPHRFERDYRNANLKNHHPIYYNETKYILYNSPTSEALDNSDTMVQCENFWESYGAAWVARTVDVKKIDFSPTDGNGLHAPCLRMFERLTAWKTKNPYNFFVDHLSGYANALNAAGLSIDDFPYCW